MTQRKPLAVAVAAALGASSFALSGPVLAQDAVDDSGEPIEEIVTTGSRIKRSTNTQSQEIITFTIEDMELAGDISVADALRSSTMNSFGSFRENSGSSAQSNATLNLRGVGSSRTLILINGRRVVGSPSLGGGGTVNLNMIPFSAVDRIEIIADGASAIYGSDAIAGVVNIILKKNYDGLRFQARYGDRDRDDGSETSFSLQTGASSDRGSVTMGIEYDSRDAIFDGDREYWKANWFDNDGDGYVTGYAETVGVSYYGFTVYNPDYEPATITDPNDPTGTIPNPNYIPFSNTNPASWEVLPGNNCPTAQPGGDTFNNGFIGAVKADLVFGPDTGFYCGYAYALVSANRASIERINSYVSADYELTDDISVFADIIIGQNESFGRYAPPAAPGPTIPGDPRNEGIGAPSGYFRWVDIGTRDNIVNDNFTDVNVGAKGDLTDTISWDLNYTYSNYVSASVGQYYLSYAGLEYNINYDIQDFDTFINNLKHTTLNDDRQKLEKVFAGMQFDLFELSGGTASAYVAAEYYTVNYAALVDAQSEAGLVGGSAGNSARGYRDVTAFAAEAIFPVTDYLEVDAAVRYDEYSDFGNATSPRVGATLEVPGVDGLVLKASYGQGFRAPDLSDLYGATSFSAEFAIDNYGCQLAGQDPCPRRQFDTFIGSNPTLDAEKSETFSFGVEYTFFDTVKTSINYFTLDLEDAILYTSAQDQLDVDFQTSGGNPQVTRNQSGSVTRIEAGFQNGVTVLNREVVDFQASTSFDTGFGLWSADFNWSHYLNYDAEESYGTGDLYNAAGVLGLPDNRMSFLLRWELGDSWFSSLNVDYIGESNSRISDAYWDSWTTANMTVGYATDNFGTFTVGATNLTDEDPPLDDIGQPKEQDGYLYGWTGRVWFARYSIEF
jgi:iron complex outermembrane receptor protein